MEDKMVSGNGDTRRFWAAFHEKLLENGEPFKLYPNGGFAVVGKERIRRYSIIVDLDPQQRELLVGLTDGWKVNPYYENCFKRYQKEFEAELGEPITVKMTRAENFYYAVMRFSISPWDEVGFEDAVEEAIVKICLYQTLIPQYLEKLLAAARVRG